MLIGVKKELGGAAEADAMGKQRRPSLTLKRDDASARAAFFSLPASKAAPEALVPAILDDPDCPFFFLAVPFCPPLFHRQQFHLVFSSPEISGACPPQCCSGGRPATSSDRRVRERWLLND